MSAPSNGPGTTFEPNGLPMTATRPNAGLGGREFRDSAEALVGDAVGQLEDRDLV